MPLIQSFAKLKEDVELVWLAGFFQDMEGGWRVGAATRGIDKGKIEQHHLPIGLLPVLALGRCFSNGDPTKLTLHGELANIVIPNLGEYTEVTADQIPDDLFPLNRKRKIQKLLRYRLDDLDVLVPTIVLIQRLFALNKTMANALMRMGGLLDLCRAERPGFYDDLHLHFTDAMPVRALSDKFASDFAWIAVHPDIRPSWDSVAAATEGHEYVSFTPPLVLNMPWTVRWVRNDTTALVLDIIRIAGKSYPCKTLYYHHPLLKQSQKARPRHLSKGEDESEETALVRQVRDYVVDDGTTGSRTDAHQPLLPISGALSEFTDHIPVIKVLRKSEEQPDRTGGSDETATDTEGTASSRTSTVRRRVRVTASVGEERQDSKLPPIEFSLLDPADPDYFGELEPLIGALRLMADLVSSVRISMSLCALKPGRAISVVGKRRRPCLVAALWSTSRPPVILLDIDHAGDVALSSLALRYRRPLPFEDMERHVKTMLDGMVDNHGHWNMDLAAAFTDMCECERLPKVLRSKQRQDQKVYWQVWAMKLVDRLGLQQRHIKINLY